MSILWEFERRPVIFFFRKKSLSHMKEVIANESSKLKSGFQKLTVATAVDF